MNFFIGIFQGFWLQISEHLFSRTLLKLLVLQRRIQDLVKYLRWSFSVNIINGLKPLTIFTKKLHLRCFTRFCVRLCSEVTSSIYQTYKFKVYCNSFWRHCNVFDVVFACINETSWRTRTRLKMRTRWAIFMSKVRNNSTPKMILGVCWGTRARDCSPFLAKPEVWLQVYRRQWCIRNL